MHSRAIENLLTNSQYSACLNIKSWTNHLRVFLYDVLHTYRQMPQTANCI